MDLSEAIMHDNEYQKFAELWATANEVSANGKVLSNGAMYMIFTALKKYPLGFIEQALHQHIANNQFAPTVAGITEIINQATGSEHLSPAEAWAIFPKSESESGMVTTEMLKAWGISSDLYEIGKHYQAEQAFLSAYKREVAESKLAGRLPKRQLTKGTNETQLKSVVEEALTKGWLSRDYANSVLNTLPKPANGVISGLIKGNAPKQTQGLSNVAKSNIAKIMQIYEESDARIEAEQKKAREDEINRRDAMIQNAMAHLSTEEQTALKSQNNTFFGNELVHTENGIIHSEAVH